jgi:hypothetical protein
MMFSPEWLAQFAERLVWVNMSWYFLLALAFMGGGLWGKGVYFLGAGVLTIGVIMMK